MRRQVVHLLFVGVVVGVTSISLAVERLVPSQATALFCK